MKILLINPPTENMLSTEVPNIVSEERGYNPPLGLMYIAASLMKHTNHEVKIIDAQVEELDYFQLTKRIDDERPDLVGITTTTFTLIDALKVAKIARYVGAKVVLGGPHCHIFPDETINLPNVDYILLGEGEYAILDLVKDLDQAPKQLFGTVNEMDKIPFPARELTPYKKYSSLLAKRTPVTTMITSRGCPYKCLFCNRPHLGKTFRPHSADYVVREIEECVGLGINEFLIYDDTFCVDKKRVMDICNKIVGKKLKIGFDIRTRVSDVDPEFLKILKRAGCERIHYGVESGNPGILKILRKGITIDQAKDAFKWSKQAGIDTLAYFMIGNPTETKETIKQTVDLAKELDPGFVHFSITTPFPQTDLYQMALDKGIIKTDVWQEFAKKPNKDFIPPLYIENLSRQELIQQLESSYRSFYTRPKYIVKRMMRIRSVPELKRKVKAGLKVLKL